ncbi:MAG: VOC family protein [Cyclobacteriaceae bacterium]
MKLKTKVIKFFFLLLIATVNPIFSQGQELRIDHVVSVVSNLGRAVDQFTKLGFSVKEGRLHQNGLLNAHVKFQNSSSVELMSLKFEAKDEVAKEYEGLLKKGINGASSH